MKHGANTPTSINVKSATPQSGCRVSFRLAILSLFGAGALGAASIPIPNASFEAPTTEFAAPPIDHWQKSPKPVWWDEASFGPWDQLSGVFLNYDPQGMTNFIDNADGSQVAFLFSVPEVAIFQDYNTIHGTNTVPTHEFDAQYKVGKAYQLAFGVLISIIRPPMEGATLEAGLYYRDAASNRITIATTTITYSATNFSDTRHLIDYAVEMPAVQPGDAWAGQHIGIQFRTTVSFELQDGVWDLDKVRLYEFGEPTLLAATRSPDEFQFLLDSKPGLAFEILASPDPTWPVENWTNLGTVTNTTGSVSFGDAAAGLEARFYRARQFP